MLSRINGITFLPYVSIQIVTYKVDKEDVIDVNIDVDIERWIHEEGMVNDVIGEI